MKKFIIIVVFCFFVIWFSSATTTILNGTENGKKYQVIKVDWDDGKSRIVVAAVPNHTPAQSLKSLMDSVWWTHAINGWFFCPIWYGRCEWNTTDWLRISDGKLYSKRWMDIAPWRSVFGFDKGSNPLKMAERDERYRDQSINHWKNDSVLAIYNGMMMPTLVKEWVNVAIRNSEMNNDPKQWKAWNKTFICSTQDKKVIYMWYVDGVTFSSLADYIIKTFGCYDAIQLDNGGTKAMIYDGKYVAGPWRNMMDAFVVIEDKKITENKTKIEPNNNQTVNNKIKIRIDGLMSVVDKQWSIQYSIPEQKEKYQKIVNSFSKVKLQWEQKEMIDYLVFLFNKKLQELN